MIPTYLVSKVAAGNVKVVLSGTGGDEIFAGYKRYKEYMLLLKLQKLNKLLKSGIVNFYQLIEHDKAIKLKELIFTKCEKHLYIKLLSDLFRGNDTIHAKINKNQYLEQYFNQNSALRNILNFDQNIYLSQDLLVKEDRATMAHSIEGRVPFLDHDLVEFANNLPDMLKLKNNAGKYILRETFKNILPAKILYRKKKGFGVPLKYYFRNELKKYAYDIIFGFNKFYYYDKKLLKKSWDLHQSGKSDYSALFWNIIIFNKWFDRWGN